MLLFHDQGGLPVAMGERLRAGRRNLEGELLFVENLVCSGVPHVLLSRYIVDGAERELRELQRGVVGSYYQQDSLDALRELKELLVLV